MPTSQRALRILVADDEASIRRAIGRFLRADLPDVEVGEAEDAKTCLQMVSGASWDLLLLDLSFPDGNGIDVLRDLRARGHVLPVVIVSGMPADPYRASALDAGAAAYIQKERVPEELREVVLSVLPRELSSSPGDRGGVR